MISRIKRSTNRRATLLIAVLVCLLVSSSLAVLGIKRSLQHRRETQTLLLTRQTEWLMEAGVMRAIQQLSDSRRLEQSEPTRPKAGNYEGETWQPVGPLARQFDATVEILVRENPDDSSQLIVETIAMLKPLDTSLDESARPSLLGSIRRRHRFTVERGETNWQPR